ncbi:MAG: hypothetical protein Q9169_006562 [Polycauliona sp. 2 TL-2023]
MHRQNHTLFYVNEDGAIDCVAVFLSGPSSGKCSIRDKSLNFPHMVPANTTHISAVVVEQPKAPPGPPGLLLVYQEPSGRISVLVGYVRDANDNQLIWKDVTGKFDWALSNLQSPQGHMALACDANWVSGDPASHTLHLSCFAKRISDGTSSDGFSSAESPDTTSTSVSTYADYLVSFRVSLNGTLPDNFMVGIDAIDDNYGGIPVASNLASVRALARGSDSASPVVWFSQAGFQVSFKDNYLPEPASGFPFRRLASTRTERPHLYHQLDGLVIAEDVWNGGTNGSWTCNNITINATVMGPNGPQEPMGDILSLE